MSEINWDDKLKEAQARKALAEAESLEIQNELSKKLVSLKISKENFEIQKLQDEWEINKIKMTNEAIQSKRLISGIAYITGLITLIITAGNSALNFIISIYEKIKLFLN